MITDLIKKLEKQGKLKKSETGAKQIESFIKQALLDLLEAHKARKASERAAYLLAYMAILKAARSLLMSLGYVPDYGVLHNIIVEVMNEVLGPKHKELTRNFEIMRRRSNEMIYEPGTFISESETDEALKKAKLLVETVTNEAEANMPKPEPKPLKQGKQDTAGKLKTENLRKPKSATKLPELAPPAKEKNLGRKAPELIEYKEKPVSSAKITFSLVTGTKAIQKVEELAREIWSEYFIPIIGDAQVQYMLEVFQSKIAIEAQIANGHLYFIFINEKGDHIGYFSVLPENNEMLISKFYIVKRFRKKGWGKAAIDFICDMAKEKHLSKIYLTVNKNNIFAIETYKKYGFVLTGQSVTDIGGGFVMDDYKLEKAII